MNHKIKPRSHLSNLCDESSHITILVRVVDFYVGLNPCDNNTIIFAIKWCEMVVNFRSAKKKIKRVRNREGENGI